MPKRGKSHGRASDQFPGWKYLPNIRNGIQNGSKCGIRQSAPSESTFMAKSTRDIRVAALPSCTTIQQIHPSSHRVSATCILAKDPPANILGNFGLSAITAIGFCGTGRMPSNLVPKSKLERLILNKQSHVMLENVLILDNINIICWS